MWVLAVDGPLMNDGTVPAVHRIDPATNEVIASVALPGRLCQGIGASPEAIWACGPDGLTRIDPATNEVVGTVELPAALVYSRIPYGAGSVWAFATSTIGPDQVVRIDPATNAVAATIDLGRVAGTMAFGLDALWVIGQRAARGDGRGHVTRYRVDAHDGDIVVASLRSVLVEQRDPDRVLTDRHGSGGEIAATPDSVWVRAPDPWLIRIDPGTGEIVDRLDTRSGPGAVTVAFGSVWVTTERGEVIRMSP